MFIKKGRYGDIEHFKDRECTIMHNEDGPARILNAGSSPWAREWWVNGKRHRMDGPAVIWQSGNKEYWVNGVYLCKIWGSKGALIIELNPLP